MMAAVCSAFPSGLFAASSPLSRHPPTTNFLRHCWILEIDDRDDIAKIAVELRRTVDVTAVERETVHAARCPGRDACRLRRIADVEDLEAALEIWVDTADRKHLAVDEHDPVLDAHLVRECSFRNLDLRKLARFCRIGHVNDACPVRRFDVSDIGDVVADNHLSAALTAEVADDFKSFRDRHRTYSTSHPHHAERDQDPLVCNQNATMRF